MDNKGFKALQGNSGSNMDVAIGAVKSALKRFSEKPVMFGRKITLTVWPGYGKVLH